MAFETDFRRHVVPVLRAEITRLAGDLADDRLSFPEALAELRGLAHRRGAGFLAEPVRDALTEWLSATLLDEACLAERAAALVTRLLREPSRDVMRRAIRGFIDDR